MNSKLKVFVGSVCTVLGAAAAYKLYSIGTDKLRESFRPYEITKKYEEYHSGDSCMEPVEICETKDAITFVKK